MGGLFGGGRPPPAPGPSATEIRLEREAKEAKEKEEKRKKEEAAQRIANRRGRRSLFSEEDEGSGFA
jgi:hypothetical protein